MLTSIILESLVCEDLYVIISLDSTSMDVSRMLDTAIDVAYLRHDEI